MAAILSPTTILHHESSNSGTTSSIQNGSSSSFPIKLEVDLSLSSSSPSPVSPPMTRDGVDDARFEVVNVCSTFKTHCHLDLKKIAMNAANVELRRDPPCVRMKLRNPAITASIWSAGKVMVVGAKSEEDALYGARRVARHIQKLGFNLRFMDFKIVNTLSCVYLPFGVRIDKLKDAYPREIEYEPELHPTARFALPEVNGQLQVSQTGNMTVTAPNVKSAHLTFRAIYPKLAEFRKAKDAISQSELRKAATKRKALANIRIADSKRWKTEVDVEALSLMEDDEEESDMEE